MVSCRVSYQDFFSRFRNVQVAFFRVSFGGSLGFIEGFVGYHLGVLDCFFQGFIQGSFRVSFKVSVGVFQGFN